MNSKILPDLEYQLESHNIVFYDHLERPIEIDVQALKNIDETIESLVKAMENSHQNGLNLASHLRQLETEFSLEALAPYFGIIWPAAIALSEYLAASPMGAETKTLELGCGLALPSLVVSKIRQQSGSANKSEPITATDQHPDVEVFFQKNCEDNQLAEFVNYEAWDWRQAKASTDWHNRFDQIIASDVIYEWDIVQPLLETVYLCLKPSGKALIADPGRVFMTDFEKAAQKMGFAVTKITHEIDRRHWGVAQIAANSQSQKQIFIFQLKKVSSNNS